MEPRQAKIETVTTPRGTYVLLASPSEHWEAWLSPREARSLAPALLEAADEIEPKQPAGDPDDDGPDPTPEAEPDDEGEERARSFGKSATVHRVPGATKAVERWREEKCQDTGYCDRVEVMVYLPDPGDASYACIMDCNATGPKGLIEKVVASVEKMMQTLVED